MWGFWSRVRILLEARLKPHCQAFCRVGGVLRL
nr:MAG TPA: hypothetical protein [Caudoviricetes sp.]